LAIRQQIGDRKGEGTTLNNISQIYATKGDYDTALRYLEQSLAILQQIGDRSGLCYTLHNIATIYLNQKEDVEKYLEYESLAYQTAQEIGDANAVFQVGWYLGGTLCRLGASEHGLPILETVYQISLQSGYPDVEEVGALIQEYSQSGVRPKKKKRWFGWW
jgi:tetratricopeptide (TPR) repeat protein